MLRREISIRKQVKAVSLFSMAVVFAACGSYSDPSNGGTPGDPFDPGPRLPGAGYGSGSGGTTTPEPMCEEALRRCPQEFIYKGTPGLPSIGDEHSVELRGDYQAEGWTQGAALQFDGQAWRVTVAIPWQTKVLYKFRIIDSKNAETWIPDPENPQRESDGFGGMNSVLSGITCPKYSCAAALPMCDRPVSGSYDWRDAVLYFVFVDRFFNGDKANDLPSTAATLDPSANWQGGDFAGVTAKIKEGYFTGLGVNALWITVPMDQTDDTGLGVDGDTHIYSAYHGYWPRDLTKLERRFGTQAEFKTLIDEAHKAGIKVLLDYAMNHVHKDSPVWQTHMNDGWFNPLDIGGGKQCLCGSAACPWVGDKAKVCWFTDYLPDLNYQNAAARDYSVNNVLGWIKDNGIDGLRLDAVKHIELSWLTDLRDRLTKEIEPTSKQHVYLVGETFSGNRDLIKSFIDPCKKLDGQFDFPLRLQLVTNLLLRQGRMQDLRGFLDGNDSYYGSGLMSTFLGNHDVPRSIHFAEASPVWTDPWSNGKDRNFGATRPVRVSDSAAYERMALAVSLLFTNRGIPLIYYGDEIGMPGAGDPDNRRFMDWNSGAYNDGQKLLLDRTRRLGQLRKTHSALRRGTRTTVSIADDTWAYQMTDGTDTVYVLLNRSDSEKTATGLPNSTWTDELLGGTVTGPSIAIPPRSTRILTKP